jgi:hypothetical protein
MYKIFVYQSSGLMVFSCLIFFFYFSKLDAVYPAIIAEKVRVKLYANWTDYVFEKKFKMLSLEDLGKYIDLYKHLPDVPTANQIEKNGNDLAEMDVILLKKIEELTLYMLNQQRKINELEAKMK